MNTPDPEKHLNVSLAKSGLRILGYVLLGVVIGSTGDVIVYSILACAVLVISEVLGIIEEFV